MLARLLWGKISDKALFDGIGRMWWQQKEDRRQELNGMKDEIRSEIRESRINRRLEN